VLISFSVFAAFDVGMREFVDQYNRGLSRQNGVNIHLRENSSFVFELFARNGVEFRDQIGYALSPMGFHYPDHHIFASAVTTDTLAEHGIGLAYTRRVPEKKLEDTLLLFGRDLIQPLFRTLLHDSIVI